MLTRSVAIVVLMVTTPGALCAQTAGPRPAAAVEFVAGYAGFVDDATIDHGIVGAAARVYLTPRLAIGPELVYMRGPGSDRDVFLTGNLTFDLVRLHPGRSAPVTPFLVAGGGFMRHSNDFGGGRFTASEGAFTVGGGVRARITDRVFALGDVRLGWEPHFRVNGGIGLTLR